MTRGDIVAEITKLKDRSGGDLLVEGGSQLAQALIQHGPIDEYRLMLFPIVLGAGEQLRRELHLYLTFAVLDLTGM